MIAFTRILYLALGILLVSVEALDWIEVKNQMKELRPFSPEALGDDFDYLQNVQNPQGNSVLKYGLRFHFEPCVLKNGAYKIHNGVLEFWKVNDATRGIVVDHLGSFNTLAWYIEGSKAEGYVLRQIDIGYDQKHHLTSQYLGVAENKKHGTFMPYLTGNKTHAQRFMIWSFRGPLNNYFFQFYDSNLWLRTGRESSASWLHDLETAKQPSTTFELTPLPSLFGRRPFHSL